MNIPMHRFKYTRLTKGQIGRLLEAADAGPTSVSELSDETCSKDPRPRQV
jgi:hypothetical protein